MNEENKLSQLEAQAMDMDSLEDVAGGGDVAVNSTTKASSPFGDLLAIFGIKINW